MKNAVPPFLLVILCLACVACSSTIYVVRHAGRAAPTASTGNNVTLTPEGFQRSFVLKDTLKNKGIKAVYTTNYTRTIQTAAPTCQQFGLAHVLYNNGDSLLAALINQRGKSSLVVGHSNTVPQMLRHAGLAPSFSGDIADNDFDNLFIIKINWSFSKRMRLLETTYGAPSP